MLRISTVVGLIVLATVGFLLLRPHSTDIKTAINDTISNATPTPEINNPLAIENLKKRSYPGSDLKIEETLDPGSNYKRYIASYTSDGNKIYGLLTVPNDASPTNKKPAIIFNHGYIPPTEYVTTERYVAYQGDLAAAGYVTYKSDYRGNGKSEGDPENPYYSPNYVIDVLNALSSVKKLPYVNIDKIGMWGHSMGGNITFKALVTEPSEIKAAVIWSGVVGTYDDLINRWHPNRYTAQGAANISEHQRSIRQNLIDKYGTPQSDSSFWKAIDPYTYISDITAPIQINQGLADEDVPPLFAEDFKNALQKNGKTVEYYTYEGADHNLSQPFGLVMQRTIAFFDKYLK
ncbi:MAG TPA: alpha/beta fold hydrolase [Patescibacteria group bacterium]|nr:alpha/beta fold hydrolase [Patescibacteria group bacterium]